MKTPISSVAKAGFRFAGFVFFSAIIGAGSAGAETYRYGGSEATIEQSGGSNVSRSQVTRYRDGQKIITQDGSSTDITIQRSGEFPSPDYGWEYPRFGTDRFDRRSMEERFSRFDLDDRSGADCVDCGSSLTARDFKQRMLDRMGGGFLP